MFVKINSSQFSICCLATEPKGEELKVNVFLLILCELNVMI